MDTLIALIISLVILAQWAIMVAGRVIARPVAVPVERWYWRRRLERRRAEAATRSGRFADIGSTRCD